MIGAFVTLTWVKRVVRVIRYVHLGRFIGLMMILLNSLGKWNPIFSVRPTFAIDGGVPANVVVECLWEGLHVLNLLRYMKLRVVHTSKALKFLKCKFNENMENAWNGHVLHVHIQCCSGPQHVSARSLGFRALFLPKINDCARLPVVVGIVSCNPYTTVYGIAFT